MEQINPRLLQELKTWDPTVEDEELVCVLATNLDPTRPAEHVRMLTVLQKHELRVYTDGELTHSEPIEEIAEFSALAGVGCYFCEYRKADGADAHLIARADGRYQNAIGQFVKRANHYLRYRDTDFSRFSDAKGRVCPKCGKPYPRGTSTCPRCTSKKKNLMRLMRLARPEWKYIAITVVLFFMTSGIGVLAPYINRVLVDDYIQNESGQIFMAGFIGVVLSILAVNLLRRAFVIARGYFLTVAGTDLIVRLRGMVFEKIQRLSISKISRYTSGELMNRVNGDTRTVKQFLINELPSMLEQGMLLVAVSAVLLFYDWKLALLILVPAPFVALAFRLFWRFMRGMFNRRRDLRAEAGATLHDIFSGIRVVKSYGMEKREEERYLTISQKERDAQLRQEKAWAVLMPILQFVMGIGEYVLLYYVGTKMLAGTMTAGEMSQFSAYASMVFAPLSALMVFPRQLMQMMTSLTRVYEIMDETLEITDSDAEVLPCMEGNIDIDHISFGYEETDEVLKDVDLHIKSGEFIGLVGKSGVGKSTLINLIMRMYDVDEGAIRIDGTDIRDIPQATLRSRMGVVLQENFLFTGSVWQNITYAKPNATHEEVIAAAKSAGAHEFIIRLPDGYNTYVGEKGHTLSGGERQRIAIARALLHDPKILILDEATASLDTETEKLIQDALQALSAGRTTIAIAHRLSTLRNASRLVVLDKGTVAEIGTHDELMEKQGLYYGLVMAQREMTRID